MTTAKVVSIHGAKIFAKGVPEPNLVEMLKDVLKLARLGEIHGAHMVIVHDDGVARKARVGRCNYAAIGCLAALSQELIESGLDDK